MPEINKKAAPQKEVLEIRRVGTYGAVEYLHRMSCGHTERRKRKASARYIACTLCAVAIQAKKELGELAPAEKVGPNSFVADEDLIDFVSSSIGRNETSAAHMTAELAAVFKIPNEMVSIVYNDDENGNLTVAGATLWLDPESIQRILQERRSSESVDEHRIRRPLGQQ